MKKLENLSANLQKISTTEQSFLFGGDTHCWTSCTTFTCINNVSDRVHDRYDDSGKLTESRTFWDDPCQ